MLPVNGGIFYAKHIVGRLALKPPQCSRVKDRAIL